LSPHLRHGHVPDAATAGGEPEIRSPEQAKNLLSSLQSGWERGRQTEVPGTGGAEDTGGPPHDAPQEEV